MKNSHWNRSIFIGYIAYCAFFILLFYSFFTNNAAYDMCFDSTLHGLLAACGINTICQLAALIRRIKQSGIWLILGIVFFLLTITFTTAQGV